MTISLLQVLCVVLGALAAYFSVRWFFRIDTAIENRRREAAHLANKLSEMGFKELPEVFLNYAVGDYSGMANQISVVIQRLRANDKSVFEDMRDVFDKLLKIQLARQEGRMMVRAELESIEKMLAPVAPVPVAPVPVAPVPVAPVPYVLDGPEIPVVQQPTVPVAPIQIVVAPAAVVDPPVAPVEPVVAP